MLQKYNIKGHPYDMADFYHTPLYYSLLLQSHSAPYPRRLTHELVPHRDNHWISLSHFNNREDKTNLYHTLLYSRTQRQTHEVLPWSDKGFIFLSHEYSLDEIILQKDFPLSFQQLQGQNQSLPYSTLLLSIRPKRYCLNKIILPPIR